MEEMTLYSPEHQAVFQRVWARVMGEAPCPIQPDPPEAARSRHLAGAEQSLPAQVPSPASQLCPLIRQSLEGWRHCRALAQRGQSPAASVLTALAGELHRQARQLSTAYFLLTGVRYWPAGALSTPTSSSLWSGLRQRYQAEEALSRRCLEAARGETDPALAGLLTEAAERCHARCRRLQRLLDQLRP